MGLVTEEDVLEAHCAAVAMRLGDSRTALLGGIRPDFVAGMPLETSPAAQLLSDLHSLNEAGPLVDGTVPLATWLLNALTLAGPRVEAESLRYLLDRYADGPLQVLTVTRALERRQSSWKVQPREKTDRVAAYFESIAGCLSDLADHVGGSKGIDRRILDKCAELEVYAQRFLAAVETRCPSRMRRPSQRRLPLRVSTERSRRSSPMPRARSTKNKPSIAWHRLPGRSAASPLHCGFEPCRRATAVQLIAAPDVAPSLAPLGRAPRG
jgi:hypothetical protein